MRYVIACFAPGQFYKKTTDLLCLRALRLSWGRPLPGASLGWAPLVCILFLCPGLQGLPVWLKVPYLSKQPAGTA